MKKLLLSIMMFGLTVSTNAEEITKELLQGRWLVAQVGDLYTKDLGIGEDIWEFRNNKWTAISNGKALRPEFFIVKGNDIVFSSFRVKVIEFNKEKMVTNTIGIVQTLKKIK